MGPNERAALVRERDELRRTEALTPWEGRRLDELNEQLEGWDYDKFRQRGEVHKLY